jgi:hypothetical protein
MNDSSGEVTMDVLSECISRLGRYKTDTEKNYLIGNFFILIFRSFLPRKIATKEYSSDKPISVKYK